MFYFTESIPYDYIFPKVYSVVHHGWAGTTHMSLKYGKSSLIIPHILDQFFWNTKNHALRTWPKWIRISKLKAKVFQEKILDLWNNESYKIEAEKFLQSMASENFDDKICEMIVK
jgi:UDP:flavonoid glycosyltransferase YjiC (YdhE family)